MKILRAAEDYLEAMLMMQKKHGYIRSIDIAEFLGVTKPSVTYTTKRLKENGYITMDREGFITRRHGVGTIINRHVLGAQARMDIEVEFLDMIRQSGHTPGVAFVRAADDKADSKVAAQLGIPTGTPILRISRLCTADGRPAIYCEDVVEKAKLQRPYTAEELRQPIFDFLQNVCGISSYLDLTDLRPVAADAALADVFQVPQGTPLLNMDEVDYDIEGAPVFASNEYFADGIFHHTVLRKKL